MKRNEEKPVSTKKQKPVVEIQAMTDALEGRSTDCAKKPIQWTAEFAASGGGKGNETSGASIEP